MSDDIDRANDYAQWQRDVALQNHIADASKMINTDPYCAACGEEIGEARRKALPTAVHCIDCQSAIESKAKHYK